MRLIQPSNENKRSYLYQGGFVHRSYRAYCMGKEIKYRNTERVSREEKD